MASVEMRGAPLPDASDPWLGANPIDPVFRANPYPALARLREISPVNQTPLGTWRLSRYADCERLLKEVPTGVRMSDGTRFGESALPRDRPGDFMLLQDPPNHTRLRRLVSQAFTLRSVEKLRAHVEEIVERQLDAVIGNGRMDVIADLALPIPSTVICEMMGVPLADRDRFTEWTADSTHLLAAGFGLPEDVLQRGLAASDALNAYFTELVAERRTRLSDDLVSGLIRAEEEGDRLTTTEMISQCIGLLIAGFETTIGLIGNGVLALIRNPDQLARLRRDPGLIANAVDECLRYDGPIQLTIRILREDTEFGGTVIPADAYVAALLGAANRDPERFDDADRFDVGRENVQNLAFGGGAHFCLGAHLARLESQAAIGGLVRRVRDIELETSELAWGRSLFRVLGSLPIRFRAS